MLRADLLRHAALLGRADGDPAVLGRSSDWLPSFGYETVGANYTGLAHVLDVGSASDHAGDDARPVLHGDLYPHDARLDAGGEAARFRQDRARQGPVRRP